MMMTIRSRTTAVMVVVVVVGKTCVLQETQRRMNVRNAAFSVMKVIWEDVPNCSTEQCAVGSKSVSGQQYLHARSSRCS
jgi:hypothetical protein